ncbi:SDR family NAD(P)-dependent oxidoreductase [Chryseolinea lacunae]|uniref:SDR family NAD(P)-dependent oxidoreductase n=1 Tax=Chryseolinea lacunae TaxID=2801331 RepID=A0ABS1KKP8_9BACT|nr:SDR family NAD(P)-dependent oxidoreductase [Chryseolinea lacunae]MBL0740039.1 SDR family NAD(P)-dependent oxidoreductase [Chryseolinea lacunae]
MKKTVFITSTGLGKLAALHFANAGWNVAATLRSPEKEIELGKHPNIRLFKLDVTDAQQTEAAVAAAVEAFGTIDVVVNNAGFGSYGALELAEESTIDWQYAVNVRGPINVIRKFLPHFRSKGGGMFINISSFIGVTSAIPVGSLYTMSKFALEGLTEALYYELEPLNIALRLVEQGGSRDNNFQNNIIWNTNPAITAYDNITSKVKTLFNNLDPKALDDPQDIVNTIYALATGESKAFRTLVGDAGKNLVAMRRELPIEEYLEKIAANFR